MGPLVGNPGRLIVAARPKVLVADGQSMLAEAIRIALGETGDFRVSEASPADATELVACVRALRPAAAIVDYWLDGVNGPTGARELVTEVPRCRVLFISWCYTGRDIREALVAGAAGFLPKSVTIGRLAEAARRAAGGEMPVYMDELGRLLAALDDRETGSLDSVRRVSALTPRELQILALTDAGMLPEEIAAELGIKRGTLKIHVHRMLKKAGVATHMELLSLARYAGLIDS